MKEKLDFIKFLEQFAKRYNKKGAILFGKWLEMLDQKKITIEETEEEEEEMDANSLIGSIVRALAGFIDALDELYNKIDPDQRPRAQLCIRTSDKKIIGIWHEDKQALSEDIDVENCFFESLSLFGDIQGEAARVLANLFAQEVLHGYLQLPGYKNHSQGADSICLTRLSKETQLELEYVMEQGPQS